MLTTNLEEDTSSSSKTTIRKNRYSVSSLKLFGVDLTPDNIAVAMVYFVQGVLGISRLAVSFYFKDELHLDPAEVCHFNKMFNGCIWIIHTFNCHFSYGVKCARMLLCIAEDLNTFFFSNKTLNNGLVVILVNILAWTTFFVMDDILICG